MRTLHDPLRLQVAQILQQSLPEGTGLPDLSQLYDALVEPPNPEMGDLAFGCFLVAKALRKSPAQIATEIQNNLQNKLSGQKLIEKAQAAGPYLNFRLSSEAVGNSLLELILSEKIFNLKLTENHPRTMIEYSQPNTHKEMHVGHMRNVSLGDALVKVGRYAGFEILGVTFPGDVGTHVAKCLWYMKYRNTEPIPATDRGEWLGRMYSKAHLKLEDEAGTPQEADNREKMTMILKQLESKSGEFYDLWKETRQWSIDLMNRVYDWAGISFDRWYWESDVDAPSLKYARELYEQGKLVQSQGAIGLDLSDKNLGFCLLIKADGTGLYATKDIELARRKFQEGIERSVYVVDVRQALHFSQVFEVLDRVGFSQAKNCFHLQYNFVELPDGAMSSRKGNIIPLLSLIEQMENRVKEQYLTRYQNEWPKEEIDLVASQVARGAIKYGMVKIDNNKKIVFDMQEWLKLDGDSGPFIQYSAARIRSLVAKLGPLAENRQWATLVHPAEKKLMAHLMNFNTVVVNAAMTDRPSILCTYLLGLAQNFNHFYHECPIGQAENADLKQARLGLAASTGKVLEKGLELLGIPSPKRM